MQIKSYLVYLGILFTFFMASQAQSEKINRDIASFTPDNDGLYKQIPFEKMPEHYADDFPLYMNMVVYKSYGKIPDIPKKDKTKLSRSDLRDMIRDVFFIAHTFKDVTPEKIVKWYHRNALNAGYERVDYYESGMKEFYELEYVKVENDIQKKVILTIKPDMIRISAFKDNPIKK